MEYDIKRFFASWNISIHNWLKNYVFLRVFRKTDKAVSFTPILMTFFVSAVWHGFYPGYFVFFIAAALYDYMFKIAGRIYLLFLWIPRPIRILIV